MPGLALHHLLGEQLRTSINNGSGLGENADYALFKSLLDDPVNRPYFHLGCQGPDFLFFNTKDWDDLPVGSLVNAYHDVYDAIESFKKAVISLVPDAILGIIEEAGIAADQVITASSTLDEIRELLQEKQKAMDALNSTLVEMTKRYITELNLMDVLDHPLGDGVDPDGWWWWFDTLHYRKTNHYLAALFKNAEASNDPRLLLYALGHLTHFTADTVGHPFVNVNSGGPYRNQGQRHKTGENFHDVFHLRQFDGRDLNTSGLHWSYRFADEDTGNIDDDLAAVPRMPPGLSKLIVDTINEVYPRGSERYGRDISTDDVDSAYRLYYRWWRSATETGLLPKPIPYSLTAEIGEVWEKALGNLETAGEILGNAVNSGGSFSIVGILKALAAAILAAAIAAAALIDALMGLITTLTVSGIRATLALIYEHIYNAFQNFRLAVSLKGLAYPMASHLDEPRFRQFQNTANKDSTQRSAIALRHHLPARNPADDASWLSWEKYFNLERHLIYPEAGPELKSVRPAPDDYFCETPLHYLFGDIGLDEKFLRRVLELGSTEELSKEEALSEFTSDLLQGKDTATLGNALELTKAIYELLAAGKQVPAFNLDADRGYGYTCWAQAQEPPDRPSELIGNPVSIRFLPQS